jgi:nitroreductase
MEALWSRSSGTEFSDKMLSDQDLSNLLFAAIGVNRPSEGKITSPTARNFQEIRVFVFTAKGVSEYLNKENSLKQVAKGDHRGLIADRQDWAKTAPVSLLIVADEKKFGSSDTHAKLAMAIDAGIVSENVNLFCSGAGFVTRPRMTMDIPAIKKLLKLSDAETPLLNNPVGYAK